MAAWEEYEDGPSAEFVSLTEFPELSDQDVSDSFIDCGDAKLTKAMTEASMRTFADYCALCEGTTLADVERMPLGELCRFLGAFYAEARQPDGSPYTKRSLLALRKALQNHFQKVLLVDIINDAAFRQANEVLDAIPVDNDVPIFPWKKQKKERNVHFISKEDMDKIRSSYLTDCSTPKGLQNTVFLNLMLHFCCTAYGRRGNLREMKKSDFVILTDDTLNRRFVCFACRDKIGNIGEGHLSLNKDREGDDGHDGDNSDEECSNENARMYEALENPAHCPVMTFEKYMAKLDPSCDAFWQRPRKYKRNDNYWYDGVAVGVNSLGYRMRDISSLAGCSMIYSNMCLNVTSRACTLRMTTSGCSCICSAQHFLPPREVISAGLQGRTTPSGAGLKKDEIQEKLKFLKDEPVAVEEEMDRHEIAHRDASPGSERNDLSPGNTHCMSSDHIGHSVESGVLYASPPVCSVTYPVQRQSSVQPDHAVTVHVDSIPQGHLGLGQPRRSQGDGEDLGAWRVERTWRDEHCGRRWVLTREFENKQERWLLREGSASPGEPSMLRGSTGEHIRGNLNPTEGFLIQTTQSTQQPNLSMQFAGDRIQRAGHHMPRPAAKEVIPGQCTVGRGRCAPAAWAANDAQPVLTGGSGGIAASAATADGEVLHLQKEVLRMQRANLALERRKMELEIAKLEAETLRMRGGS
ncbi:uncharacterized protein LOC110982639 [Acanthaster planci]|uniref:Uncharacterized protein LOC110982639 n=1 Tax=Acanthaster planci TaxID=133434 RepID=A0A8B7YUC0_ACAPL|nr:uncharacterized protein LOC110982639 [Acanthaster planci]